MNHNISEYYDKNTIYVIGNAKTNSDNAITQKFNSFFIGFVINGDTSEIIDLSCSATIRTTEYFIASLFIGKKFGKFDKDIEEEVKRRYLGSSQKAIIVAYKDAVKKYSELKQK